MKKDQICLLLISIEGINNFKHMNPILIFIKPPNMQKIEQRLKERKNNNSNEIKQRLERAQFEMDFVSNNFELFHHIIINDDLDTAYTELEDIFRKLF